MHDPNDPNPTAWHCETALLNHRLENPSWATGQLAAEWGLIVGERTLASTIRGTGALTPLMGLGHMCLTGTICVWETTSLRTLLRTKPVQSVHVYSVCVSVHLFWPAQHVSLWSSDAHLEHACLLLLNKHKTLAVSFSALLLALSAQAAVRFPSHFKWYSAIAYVTYMSRFVISQATHGGLWEPTVCWGSLCTCRSKGGDDPCRETLGHCVSDWFVIFQIIQSFN